MTINMAIHIDSQLPPLDQRKMALLGGVLSKSHGLWNNHPWFAKSMAAKA